MNTAHIFYNGDDLHCPNETEASNWGAYKNPDSGKMFAVCADSWERHGWQVERLMLNRAWPVFGRFKQSNYPYNALIPALFNYTVARSGIFIVTTDVINLGFVPEMVNPTFYADIPFPHFTMAAGWFSRKWICEANRILFDYAHGKYADLTEHTDENVLRHYMPDMQQYCFATSLVKHYSRSMIERELSKRNTFFV